MPEPFKRQTFAAGECLISEGGSDSPAYLILSGKVEVRTGAKSEHPKTLDFLKKGNIVGEMALLDRGVHTASVIAVEKTVVGVLTAEEFSKRIESMDPMMKGILTIMVKRLRKAGEIINSRGKSMDLSNWKPD